MDETKEFYDRFKTELEKSHAFPENYAFKFIVENDSHKMAQIQQIFDSAEPQYSTKDSKNGKYSSLTVNIYALDSDSVIDYYQQVSKIEGVIMM